MQLAVLLFPPLQSIFSVVPMDGGQWLTVLLLAAAPIPICELTKALGRRREGPEAGRCRRPWNRPTGERRGRGEIEGPAFI